MELEETCDICSLGYNQDIVPKMLSCGHTFCLSCVTNIIHSGNPVCRECNEETDIDKEADEYPTNYLGYNIIKLHQSNDPDLFLSPERIKKNLLCLKQFLKDQASHKAGELNSINYHLTRLDAMNDRTLRLNETKNVIEMLEFKYKNNLKFYNFSKLRNFAIFRSTRFNVLIEIYERLQNEDNIYAAKYKDTVLYGKMSFRHRKLLIHSLSETVPSNPADVFCLDGLRENVFKENILTFLKLPGKKRGTFCFITIKMIDSQLASKFISLCTGEDDLSFKGCSYDKLEYPNDENGRGLAQLQFSLPRNIVHVQEYIDVTMMEDEDIHVILKPDGTVHISRLKWSQISRDSVGKVESPVDLEDHLLFDDDVSELKVLDSGIIIKF